MSRNRGLIDAPNDDYGEMASSAIPSVSLQLEHLRETADLGTRMTQSGTVGVSGLGDRYYARGREFELLKTVPIPLELQQQMQQTRSRFEMGLFPEIARAWVTIDCDIFMWNYETNDDLAYFDGIQNTIVKISLARPKTGVFQAHVHWVLVVATVLDVQLLAVTVTGREVSIIPETLFKVDVENALVNDIVSTAAGRIFFTANENLFELEYYDNGWFRRHCKKVNRSTNLLQSFIPFLSPVTEEILQVVVDNSRHLLFALTKRSSLQVYDLGVKGNACTKITNLTSGQIIHEASAMSGGQHDPSMFSNIIRIIPLYAENSHQLNLLAVTARGVRLYFSVLPKQAQPPQGQYVAHLSMSQMEARPICLRICHIRFAPGLCPTSTYRDPADGAYMSQASNSTCILATHPQGRFMLFAISDLYHPASRSFVETISEFMLNGPVWAIHVQSKPLCSSEAPMGDLIPPAQTHPFYRMHANAPEVITIFTSEGLSLYQQRPPVLALREALTEHGFEGSEIEVLLKEMGPVNALVLALMLLSSEKPVDQQHHDKALRLFYSLKDEPEMVDVDQVRDWNDANDSFRDWNARMRSPLRSSTPFHERTMASPMNLNGHSPIGTHDYSFTHGNSFYQFRPSKRHDALYAYFARLVAPLWSQPIVLVNDGRLHPLVSEASLNWLSHQLRLFLAAIDDNNLIPRQLPPQASDYTSLNAKFSAEAYARERSSILALHALIILTLETLALWAVAVEYGMHQVSASVDSNSLMLLSGRRLSDLVTGDSNLNNDLIKGLIKYFLGDEAGTRDLSDRLRNVCPTLYSKEDALITNATEMLDRALRQGLTLDSQNIVRTAVLYLKQSINKVSLPVVSQQLSQLQSYDAIVELCLLRAKKDDPKQLAIAAYRNGGVAEGNKEMAEASNRRENSYAVFRRLLEDVDGKLDAQTIRDQISKCVLASDDELAHAALFRWMLQNHQAEKIIQSKSQFVEQFLQHEIGRGGGHKYLDLLWRFYEKSNTFDKAAKLLVRLADCTTMPEITLDQRISYLSHAIMCAQSSTDSKIKEKIQEMRDKLDVANVQLSARQALASIATPQCRQAVKELDKSLFVLQDLCERYVQPFQLHRVMLAAYRCAAYYKEDDIHRVWNDIIDQEFNGQQDCAFQNVLSCIGDLALLYKGGNYFPEEFIVLLLLEKTRDRRMSADLFPLLLKKMKMPLGIFLKFITEEFRSDRIWSTNLKALRFFVDLTDKMVNKFIDEAHSLEDNRKQADLDACKTLLALITLTLKKQNIIEIVSELDQIETLNARLTHGRF